MRRGLRAPIGMWPSPSGKAKECAPSSTMVGAKSPPVVEEKESLDLDGRDAEFLEVSSANYLTIEAIEIESM